MSIVISFRDEDIDMAIQITNEQLKKLEPSVLDRYITELVTHCDEKFPYLKKTMGAENLEQVLRKGINKANEQGFTQRGPVKFYIDLLIVFGWSFETDPQYAWIIGALEKQQHLTQLDSTSLLYDHTIKYLNNISGERSQYLFDAAIELDQLTLDAINLPRENYIQQVHAFLERVYPQKYHNTQSDNLTLLIKQGITKSYHEYNFVESNHVSLVVLLMFLLGHEFDYDPFYVWARSEKTNSYATDSLDLTATHLKAEKLQSRAKIWLTAAIKNEQSLLAK